MAETSEILAVSKPRRMSCAEKPVRSTIWNAYTQSDAIQGHGYDKRQPEAAALAVCSKSVPVPAEFSVHRHSVLQRIASCNPNHVPAQFAENSVTVVVDELAEKEKGLPCSMRPNSRVFCTADMCTVPWSCRKTCRALCCRDSWIVSYSVGRAQENCSNQHC